MKRIWALVCSLFLFLAVPVQAAEANRIIVIDAGHGGVDGGAVSCTGVYESRLNLEIAQRLEALLQLLGQETLMLRSEDISLHTKDGSIAAKKVSDLRHRVQIINDTPNALLVSIHQNHFSQSKYRGAQVFWGKQGGGRLLAVSMQRQLVESLNPGSNRKARQASGVYLMDKITQPGVLIECGFLSNPEEEAMLRSPEYQKKLCCVIAAVLSGTVVP